METSVMTVKGQIVVPAKLRKKLGLKKGAKVAIIEDEHGFLVRPLNRTYFDQYAGILPGRGKATKALLEERRGDRDDEDARAR
ncbi:MAG: AbrB/MazE/SpoVT family DNA-binding domain-containing protein [Nitrospirae bacterium]|nr:AbrB/MazE/SpoVT family DNA-binding domain-containing protein [Nitrospirota bacterium]